jgi:ribonucleotide monophosphatase NagD (HAD superfamily)
MRTYLLDASGVIYNDGIPFPGVVDKIRQLQFNAAVYIATNNTSASPTEIMRSLQTMDIHVPISHILSSGLTLAADPSLRVLVSGKRVFLYGLPGAGTYVTEAGGILVDLPGLAEVFVFTHATPAAVTDPMFLAMQRIRAAMPDFPIVCLNPDRYVVSGPDLYPVVGHVVERFDDVIWAGKPENNYAEHVISATLQRDGIACNHDVTFVDDNPENVMSMTTSLGISGVVVTETGLAQHDPWRASLARVTNSAQIRCLPGLWAVKQIPSQPPLSVKGEG